VPVAKVTHCRHASGELPSQRFADHGVDLFPRKLRDPLQRHDAAVADQVDMRVDQPQEARSHRHNRLGHSRMVARIPTAQPRQCHHPRRARWRRRTRNLHHRRHGLHESRTHCRATQASGACQMRISCEEPARGIRPPPIRITFISLLLPLTDVRPDEFRNAVGLRTGSKRWSGSRRSCCGLTSRCCACQTECQHRKPSLRRRRHQHSHSNLCRALRPPTSPVDVPPSHSQNSMFDTPDAREGVPPGRSDRPRGRNRLSGL